MSDDLVLCFADPCVVPFLCFRFFNFDFVFLSLKMLHLGAGGFDLEDVLVICNWVEEKKSK